MWRMTEPLCILACGVRQVSDDTEKMDQPAEKIPGEGRRLSPTFLQLMAAPQPDCSVFVAAGKVNPKWWVELTPRRERGHGPCPYDGGVVTHAEPR